MARIEVTRLAREDLDQLIDTHNLPDDTRERLRQSLRVLEEFPRAGKALSGAWSGHHTLVGPWGWLIVVYTYFDSNDRVVIVAFQDARTSTVATGSAEEL